VEERSHDSRTYSTRVMLRRLDGDKALAIYGRPIVTTAGNASGVSAQMTPPEPVDEMLDAEDPVFSGWGTLFSGSTLQPTHRVLLNDLRSAWCAQRAVSRIVLIRADVNRPYARSGSRRLMFDVLGDHIVPGQYARMERGSSIATR
jgi:hypothetical protein